MTYQGLLAAVEETEGEYGETRTMMKSKSTTVEDETSIKQLQEKIETSMSVVKTSSVVNKTSGSQKKPKFKTPRRDTTISPDSPAKSKAVNINGSGTAKSGNKPMQYYNCWGWGHRWRNCPTAVGNLDWRSLNRARLPPAKIEQGPNQSNKN